MENFKNLVRPVSLIYTLLLFSIIVIIDSSSNGFNVKDIYVNVFETVLVTMVVSYFGSRGVEKVQEHRNGVGLQNNTKTRSKYE